jgi:DNA modification methylase
MFDKKDLFGNIVKSTKGIISDKFLYPPFSVLNARDGFWQSRKNKWLSLGIQSEIGRTGKTFEINKWVRAKGKTGLCGNTAGDGTSIFDPVLCELMYLWFSPLGGTVLDPFAGGSVRGIVAHCLNRKYYGIELRTEQVEANITQSYHIIPDNPPLWVEGDALDKLDDAPECDFIFSCPPFGDLEKYSDDPRDLSNMKHDNFIFKYASIIQKSCNKLKNNRFACFVVSEFRDERGYYRNFIPDTVYIFNKLGLLFYNEIILVNVVGSLPIRINKQFDTSRKIGKTHQNILVFCKGDAKKATENIIKMDNT